MALYRISGTVEYKTVYKYRGETMKMDKKHTFTREIKADTPKEAYEKAEASIRHKYRDRPNFVTTHEDIRITDFKMYELKEITEADF